jgi:hypothetical protein
MNTYIITDEMDKEIEIKGRKILIRGKGAWLNTYFKDKGLYVFGNNQSEVVAFFPKWKHWRIKQ